MPNLLANSSSIYLRQHAENPIDWYPWGDEAFAKAKAEGKPIFLSIGYSSCHWCHVMAHETFEDPAVGEFLNKHFVSIKLDREEYPDVDETYMVAVQMMTQGGGWPMTIFLTPDKKPFFAGTYFPKEDRQGYPGFMTLARQIAQLWSTDRRKVLESANEIAAHLGRAIGSSMGSLTSTIQPELFAQCFSGLQRRFDSEHGGFGEAPKFPAHTAIRFLTDYAMVAPEQAQTSLVMAITSLTAMSLGGIHDHVGGGFHRYSTDAEWLLPHFEKMLTDNAQMLLNYVRAAEILEEVEGPQAGIFVRSAMGIMEWTRRDMTAPNGMFYTAVDADSEGEEGVFYQWTTEEVTQILGDRAPAFIEAYQMSPEGNAPDEATRKLTGRNVLYANGDADLNFRTELEALARARAQRVAPQIDTKCVAAANGMMIAALAQAGEISMALASAQAWLAAIEEFGTLPHQVTDGKPSGFAYLDDFAHMGLGFIALARSSGEQSFAAVAQQLADEMVLEFWDKNKGGFFFTSDRHTALFARSKPVMDQSAPAANAVALELLLHLGDTERAEQGLMAVIGMAQKVPDAAESMIRVAMTHWLLAQSAPEGAPTPVIQAAPAPAAPVGKVRARLEPREVQLGADGLGHAAITLEIPEGLHLNTATPPARWLIPTEVVAEGVKIKVAYPAGANDQYEGTTEFPITLDSGGQTAEFELRVKFQACTDRECLAPDELILDGIVRK